MGDAGEEQQGPYHGQPSEDLVGGIGVNVRLAASVVVADLVGDIDAYGHTPLSAAEDIPWQCRRLVIGTGADGALPVMKEVHEQARRRDHDRR